MKNVMFLCNWGESSTQLLKRYGTQTPDNSNIWKGEIKGVDNHIEADYFIVLEGEPKSNFSLPKDKVIYLKREPNYIINFKKPNYKYVRSYEDGNCGITWWINKPFNELKVLPYPEKTKKCSLITGYKYPNRKKFLDRVFSKPIDIDLFGRGIPNKFPNYKGELKTNGNCKLGGMLPYEYSLTLLNSQQTNCFTEKICDAYLSWSMPIYWGCPNILEFFPNDSVRLIDINSPNIRQEIIDIISKPITQKEIEAIAIARELVLNKYNIWEVVRLEVNKI